MQKNLLAPAQALLCQTQLPLKLVLNKILEEFDTTNLSFTSDFIVNKQSE
ncbi:hypothetical protein SAMN05216556_10788 [Aequorivita viscosa]|uniref:Uncharacterized protein n=1 Tax=Aequorivita viscosa TaxID=797419 RepID=A0A1M6K1Z5_9FLAO|nr:hypothetical protein SAMN05216556_10788 [Aequorivita viscosa]SHJ52963.1 hypothetical protein SAMN04487908_11911 [Aequorivita viscosa]